MWRSANCTGSVVAVACHLTVCTGKINCCLGPLDVLGTCVTASCSLLPFHHSSGQVIGNDLMHSRDVWTDVSMSVYLSASFAFTDASENVQHALADVFMAWKTWTHLWVHADVPINASAGFYLVILCGHLQSRMAFLADVGGCENFSVCKSSVVAINSDGHCCGAIRSRLLLQQASGVINKLPTLWSWS